MPDRSIGRRRTRAVALVLLSLLVVGMFGVVARQSWTSTSAGSRLIADERDRIAYLGPLSRLVGALTETQSAVVRATPPDTEAVRSAMDAVDAADSLHRDTLGTGQRWAELRARITATIAQPGTGQAAYQAFADVLTLALDLVRRVGDTSDLVRDPQLDSYYVMDTALLSLPRVVVSAGRAADLATLAGGGTVTGPDAVRVAVARHDVAQEAADANASLAQSIKATARPTLGSDLAGELDGFRAAVDEFAPLAILDDLTSPIDADSLPPAAGSVRIAALALGTVVLSELEAILADRDADLTGQRDWTIGAGIGILIAVPLLLWLALMRLGSRSTGRPADAEAAEPAEAAAYPADPVLGGLTYVRDLPDFDALVQVRREARARHRGRDEHAD